MHRGQMSRDKLKRHPFVVRLDRYLALSDDDLDNLWQLVEAELTIGRRRDLVVDGYEYRRLCRSLQAVAQWQAPDHQSRSSRGCDRIARQLSGEGTLLGACTHRSQDA